MLCACSRHRELPVYGQIPEFQLVSQNGQPFDRKSLDGKVWVADFIFTNCEGPCPRMSSHMRALQTATASTPELKLVSFTVDPAHDTPPVLAAYANNFHAADGRWYFLTGEPKTLEALDHDAFKLGSLNGSMDHSTRFVLIDKKSRIRGYYGIADGNPVERILADARVIEKEL